MRLYHVTSPEGARAILREGFAPGWGDAGYGVYFFSDLGTAEAYAKSGGWDHSLGKAVIVEADVREAEKVVPHPEWPDPENYAYVWWVDMSRFEDDEGARLLPTAKAKVVARGRKRRFYHVTSSDKRDSILKKGLVASKGWSSGAGVFVTTNPVSWDFMFEPGGIYESKSVDVWEVDTRGLSMIPDDNETADPEQDFILQVKAVAPWRLRLKQTLVWKGERWRE